MRDLHSMMLKSISKASQAMNQKTIVAICMIVFQVNTWKLEQPILLLIMQQLYAGMNKSFQL